MGMATNQANPKTDKAMPFRLCFQPLHQVDRALAFPCDQTGLVDMDSLDHVTKHYYLFARALIGKDYRMPVVEYAE